MEPTHKDLPSGPAGASQARSEKPVSTRTRVNVGPKYQVTRITEFFLDGNGYNMDVPGEAPEPIRRSGPRLIYSSERLEQCAALQWAGGVPPNTYIKDRRDNMWFQLTDIPFDAEIGYKLLHMCDYDCGKVIITLQDPNIDIMSLRDILAIPKRKYQNKWAPGDLRGSYPATPWPPINRAARFDPNNGPSGIGRGGPLHSRESRAQLLARQNAANQHEYD